MNEPLGLMEDQQRRRESAMRNLTPAARHQAFPTLFAKPMPVADPAAEIRQEVAALKRENNALRSTVDKLEEEKRQLAEKLQAVLLVRHVPAQAGPTLRDATMAEVQSIFLRAYNDLSAGVDGRPYTLADLTGARRSREYAWPRQVCMTLVRRICAGKSLPMIGVVFGDRDHTTVLHALGRAPDHMVEVPVLAATHARVIEHFRVR